MANYDDELNELMIMGLIPGMKSFENTRKWVDDVRGERGNDVIIVLVGNKTDLNDRREVTTAQAEEEAREHNLMFIETSAKLGHNVKALFKRIAQALPGMEADGQQAANQSEFNFVVLTGCCIFCCSFLTVEVFVNYHY